MKQRTELLFRLYLTVFVFLIVAGALMYRTIQINVFQGEELRTQGKKTTFKNLPIIAERGDIQASDGSLLATSLPFFDIRLDLKVSRLTDQIFEENVASCAKCLAEHIDSDMNAPQFEQWLRTNRKSDSPGARYLLVKRQVNYDGLERLKECPILNRGRLGGGLIVERSERRVKPFNELASRTIGLRGGDRPSVGLENYYNDYLSGQDGVRLMQRVSEKEWIPVVGASVTPSKRGSNVVTTLDVEIQDVSHQALVNQLIEHNATKGVAIVMEVETGAIKGMVNLRANGKGQYVESYNDAIGTAYEPGSTIKLATIMSLLEDGYASKNTLVDVDGGRARFHDRILKDSEPHNMQAITMQKAFEKSSNVGMAKLVTAHYREKEKSFVQRFKQFNLHRPTGIDLRGEANPHVKSGVYNEDGWFGTSLPWMACGYELTLSPIQVLNLYNSVANDGRQMRPYLVQEVQKSDGKTIHHKPEVLKERIASPYTINTAKEFLEGVVERGSGERVQSSQIRIAGKTGTAQTEYGGSAKAKHIASFAGYFPAEAPKYSCIVVIWEPKAGHIYGGRVAGPAFKAIAERITSMQKSMIMEFAESGLSYDEKIDVSGSQIDMVEIFSDLTMVHEDEGAYQWASAEGYLSEAIRMRSLKVSGESLPDVRGMGPEDAVYLLEREGYRVHIRGSGKVSEQIQRGMIENNQVIDLILE